MFGVRGAESFQAEYQRLVEVWLRRITDLEEGLDRASQKQGEPKKIEVRDKENTLLYGETEDGKITCTISPEQMQQLEEALPFEPGDELKGLPSLKIEVDGETFFSSESEKIVVNEKFVESVPVLPEIEPEEVQQREQEGENDQEEYRSSGVQEFRRILNLERTEVLATERTFGERSGFDLSAATEPVEVQRSTERSRRSPKVEPEQGFQAHSEQGSVATFQAGSESLSERHSELLNSSILNSFQALTDALVEMMVPIIEALPAVEEPAQSLQKEEDLFFDSPQPVFVNQEPLPIPEPIQEESVLLPQKTGLDAVKEALGEIPLGSLKSLLQGMTIDMQATADQQPPNPALDTLLSERSFDKSNPQWWQQLGNKLDLMVTTVRENFTQHRAASTLKDLANRLALQPGDSYEGADYNLSRVGLDYTLTDKQGNELMKFQPSPLGVKVDKSLPALSDSHFRKTEQLRLDFKEGRSPDGSFMSQGAAEAKNIKRINTITQALFQYAAAQGGKASVEGKFNYSFEASSSGSAIIRDSEGKALLAVAQGHMRSRMSQKDLKHFEQMLPALGGMQHKQPVTAGNAKQKGIGSRE
jgi:hypothetical protein